MKFFPLNCISPTSIIINICWTTEQLISTFFPTRFMDEIWGHIQRHPKTYILLVSAAATFLVVNETLDFVQKVSQSRMLLVFSIITFYFFNVIIIEEVNDDTKK